ncbi:MAG: spermidine/putrescine ABC transporter substrate-binding protein [Actinomycetota bacterium]
MLKKNKLFRWITVLGALAVVAAACSDGDGESAAPTSAAPAVPLEEQEIVVSNWAAYTPEGLVEDFEAETGVEVTLLEDHVNNEDIIGKLQASGGTGRDVVFFSGQYVQTLLDNGWLAELDHSQIPNLENLYPEANDLAYDPGNRYSVPYTWGTTGLCYRTDLVDKPIDSWQDLLNPDPSLAGKITMLGTERWLLQPALLTLGYSINTQNPAEIEEAKELTIAAKENLLAFDDTVFYEKLDSGEAALVQGWDGWCNYATNENVEFVVPSEGGDLWADVMTIMEASENKEAAHAFIDFVLRPENHVKVAELVLYKVPNEPAMEMLDPAIVKAYPNLSITPEELLAFEVLSSVGDAQAAWSQAAAEIKAS